MIRYKLCIYGGGTLLCLICLFLIGTAVVSAQGESRYQLLISSVDGGGGFVTGGNTPTDYTLIGIVGQPVADVPLAAGGYTLAGGLWPTTSDVVTAPSGFQLYLPIISKP